jgi:hypothetical protein
MAGYMKSPIYALEIEGRVELRREDVKERKEKKLRLRLLEIGTRRQLGEEIGWPRQGSL